MYLLDTHVISDLRKAKPGKADQRVLAWAESVPASGLYMSAMTVLGLEMGVLLIERRDPAQGAVLRSWLNTHVLPAFFNRIVPVDTGCCSALRQIARTRPRIRSRCTHSGNCLGSWHASGNPHIRDFVSTGVELLNPWEQES